MKTRLLCAFLFGLIGAILGSSIGLAGSFGATNGAVTFCVIGFVFGCFSGPDFARLLAFFKRSK